MWSANSICSRAQNFGERNTDRHEVCITDQILCLVGTVYQIWNWLELTSYECQRRPEWGWRHHLHFGVLLSQWTGRTQECPEFLRMQWREWAKRQQICLEEKNSKRSHPFDILLLQTSLLGDGPGIATGLTEQATKYPMGKEASLTFTFSTMFYNQLFNVFMRFSKFPKQHVWASSKNSGRKCEASYLFRGFWCRHFYQVLGQLVWTVQPNTPGNPDESGWPSFCALTK